MKILKVVIALILIVAAGVLISLYGSKWLSGSDGSGNGDERRGGGSTEVVVEPVGFARETVQLEAVGNSRALRSVQLYAPTAGEVESIDFQPGEMVEQGERLLTLETDDEELALRAAEVQVEEARRQLERYRESREVEIVPQATIDTAETALNAAIIARDRAQVALQDRYLTAPFEGYIGLTDVEVGDRIGTNTLVATLDARQTLRVSFEVPEQFFGELNVGEPLDVRPWNQRNQAITGKIAELDTQIDPVTRTFGVRAHVPNEDDRLRPGMSFRINLALAGERYAVVPEISVRWGTDGSYVWSVIDGKAEQVPATVVQRREGRVLVDGDFESDQLVVTDGVQRMRPGLPINAIAPEEIRGVTPINATVREAASE